MVLFLANNKAILAQIGVKVRNRRLSMQLSQQDLATNAGTSLSSVKNLEGGENCSLNTLLSVLRALRALDLLEPFAREEELSPIAVAEAQKKSALPKRIRKKQ